MAERHCPLRVSGGDTDWNVDLAHSAATTRADGAGSGSHDTSRSCCDTLRTAVERAPSLRIWWTVSREQRTCGSGLARDKPLAYSLSLARGNVNRGQARSHGSTVAVKFDGSARALQPSQSVRRPDTRRLNVRRAATNAWHSPTQRQARSSAFAARCLRAKTAGAATESNRPLRRTTSMPQRTRALA